MEIVKSVEQVSPKLMNDLYYANGAKIVQRAEDISLFHGW